MMHPPHTGWYANDVGCQLAQRIAPNAYPLQWQGDVGSTDAKGAIRPLLIVRFATLRKAAVGGFRRMVGVAVG